MEITGGAASAATAPHKNLHHHLYFQVLCAIVLGAVRPGQLHVAIIGAGATGTELAAQLHRTTRQIAAFGLDRIDPEKDFRITLIEGADPSCRRCPSVSPTPQPSC